MRNLIRVRVRVRVEYYVFANREPGLFSWFLDLTSSLGAGT